VFKLSAICHCFMAELPRFEGEEHQNVYTKMNRESEFTQEYIEKAVEMVLSAPLPLMDARKITWVQPW
jgi:hypothetical protein